MKKSGSILRAVLTASLLALIATASPVARAQETADRWAHWDHWSGWWYGLYGGVNINLFSGALHSLGTADTSVAVTTGFDAGNGLALALGGIIEYNNGKLLGGNVMFGYDSRGVIFDTKNGSTSGRTAEKLTARVGYFTIEPNLRINLGLQLLHFTVGPSFRLLLSKGYDYSYNDDANPTTPVTSKGDFANIRSFVTGAQAGLGYDIPLHDYHAASQVIITPFAQFHISQDLLDVPAGNSNKYGLNTIRIGVQAKYGVEAGRPIVEDTNGPAPEFALRAPNVVTESRKLNETFPLRNYIFFDAGSTEIPSRYKTISTADAATFREDQLIRPTVETGGTDATQVRSRRQMEVYYQVMNIFADRLRKNPSATIKLTGSANGDAATGKKMADKVRDYLVSTFGIDAARIKTDGRAMPGHKSGSGNAQGEDKKLVDAENYRVEIEGTPADIMQPVNISSVQDEPIDNDIVITVPTRSDMISWSVDVTERGTANTQTFGPYSGTNTARLNSKQLLGSRSDARYDAKVTILGRDGKSTSSASREFRLVHGDEGETQVANRYSILFEFDDSKTVQTYETFLTQTVAPAIPNGASVIIHGHTDVTGEPEYNTKLSQGRSEEAQRILTRELTKAGKNVTFDTYGFGEDERRSPFNNTLPEQRFYNRTVVIEVVPGR